MRLRYPAFQSVRKYKETLLSFAKKHWVSLMSFIDYFMAILWIQGRDDLGRKIRFKPHFQPIIGADSPHKRCQSFNKR
ncbi:hypothetical protein HCUR_00846 [Holospora curviuscula]|uniref:Uncharacterized protein n=1 Tax=Holospora curviuscula TaxID=1082868 RepID=A0A2S5R8T2_9PROT|nr:hypothetical protein HCUR_00846 [Holospora curviuscula]